NHGFMPTVTVIHGREMFAANVIPTDPAHDLAILQCAAAVGQPVRLRSLSTISIGERVYAIGAPLCLENTLSEGLVSGIRQMKGSQRIQTTAPISHGSSGGGLFDAQGRLVGITSSMVENGQNINF